MLIEISEIDMKEFLDWANQRAFCNSGQHVCDRIATTFEGTPAEDRYGHEPNCNPKPYENDCKCGALQKARQKVKPLAQYLDEYLRHEIVDVDLELLEQALDAYQSTENVTIKIERNII